MSKSNLLLHITNSTWLIEPSAVSQFAPMIKSLLDKDLLTLDQEAKSPAVIFIGAEGNVDMQSDGTKVQPGSVAVVSITGAIMKYDNCGDAGTQSIGQLVKSLSANASISAIVFKMDSPGGAVAGTEDLANIIKSVEKPTIAFVDGMCASACYWLASQCDEIYCANKTDQVGSIGTMCSFQDAKPYFEKQGIISHEIYAAASKDKNQDYLQAVQGNYDLIKTRLNAINNVFLASVVSGRGDALDQKETLTGKMFLADDAVKNGLINDIKSFDETIARAMELSSANQSNNSNNNQSQNEMKVGSKFTAMLAFLGATFSFKAEETVLTEEHLEKINAELATLATVTSEKEEAVSQLATANTTIAEKETALTNLQAAFDAFKTGNPGTAEVVKIATDSVDVVDANQFLTSVDKEAAQIAAANK